MSETQCCLRLAGENFAFLSLGGVGQPITHVAVRMCVYVCVFGGRGGVGDGTSPTDFFVKREEDKHSAGQRSHESK